MDSPPPRQCVRTALGSKKTIYRLRRRRHRHPLPHPLRGRLLRRARRAARAAGGRAGSRLRGGVRLRAGRRAGVPVLGLDVVERAGRGVVDEAVDDELVRDGGVVLQEPPVLAGGGVGAREDVELHVPDRGRAGALDLSGVDVAQDVDVGKVLLHLAVTYSDSWLVSVGRRDRLSIRETLFWTISLGPRGRFTGNYNFLGCTYGA